MVTKEQADDAKERALAQGTGYGNWSGTSKTSTDSAP
jgi:hypothetical protein